MADMMGGANAPHKPTLVYAGVIIVVVVVLYHVFMKKR